MGLVASSLMDFSMNKAVAARVPAGAVSDWKQLFEAALGEQDPGMFPERLLTAKDAIVGKIEDSFETASPSDRLLLLTALNTISGLFEVSNIQRSGVLRTMSRSA